VPTALALAGFAGISELDRFLTSKIVKGEYKAFKSEELHQALTPESASDTAKFGIELADFIAKGGALHGLYQHAPRLAETITRTKVERYNFPTTVTIPKETIFDYLQSAKTDAKTKGILDDLELTKEQKVRAL
jgi:hypothetical protein